MNNTGITKVTGITPNGILFSTANYFAVSIVVDSSAVQGNATVVKAGAPLTGSLEARTTAFTAAETTDAIYQLTADTALATGKTYYTRTGSGTTESPYVYTVVASPDVDDIAIYYELYQTATSNAVGILLHDVDISSGDNNGTLLVAGEVNLDMLDSTTAALITGEVKTALNKIAFCK